MRKYIISIIIVSILLGPSLALADMGAPENMEEAKWFGERIVDGIPGAFKTAWQEGVYIFNRSWNWIWGVLKGIGNRLLSILGKEVEQRKPEVKEEFNKELKEMKEDVPKTTKSLWERLKDLVY